MLADSTSALPPDFWGKLRNTEDGQPCEWHPLLDHCADVAACCEALLTRTALGRRLATIAGRKELDETTHARLGVLAALHDLGKFNLGFQNKAMPKAQRPFEAGHVQEFVALFGAHSAATRRLRQTLPLAEWSAWGGDDSFTQLLLASISHHGKPVELDGPVQERLWQPQRQLDPFAGMQALVEATRRWFPAAWSATPAEPLPATPVFHHAFAGLVMLADWLGSDTKFFPYAERREDRMPYAREAAARALQEAWVQTDRARRALGVEKLGFAQVSAYLPRPMQAAVGTLPELEPGSVVILEAETGAGKTEAASLHFLQLLQAGAVDGMYFALPTRTAAGQIHQRLCEIIARALPDANLRPPVVLAVPGYIAADDQVGQRLPKFEVLWPDQDRFRHRGWAAEHPKRYLAGSVVVGTVDQVLLSALTVGHAHLRGTALLRHLLVVDEVHASDVYMTRLLESVLDAHLAAGGRALLMSATLAAETRQRLLQRRGRSTPPSLAAAQDFPYPLLTTASAQSDTAAVVPGHSDASKQVEVRVLAGIDDADVVAQQALAASAQGARVLIVRNTVGACIATQAALERQAERSRQAEQLFRCGEIAAPHHARFAKTDRELLDAALEKAFGKDAARPGGCVLAATQTVQQSLDIDADLLLTDLCPMDVLLQRLGRLHRHAARRRPAGFEMPRALVLAPSLRELGQALRPNGEARGTHGFGSVYPDLRVLAATLQQLSEHQVLRLPAMNRQLVEGSLHSHALKALTDGLGAEWMAHGRHIEGLYYAHRQQAALQLLDRSKAFSESTFPSGELSRRIATRLGEGDRLVTLDHPQRSPFKAEITSLTLPAWMAPSQANDEPVEATACEGGFAFVFGDRRFRYDRLGLHAEPSVEAREEEAA